MKYANKMSLLAALGVSMSLACIVVRTDQVSATGSMHAMNKYDWSGSHASYRAPHSESDHGWWHDTHKHQTSGAQYHSDRECTCDTEQASQDETTDVNSVSQNENDIGPWMDAHADDTPCEGTADGDFGNDADTGTDTDNHHQTDPGTQPDQSEDTDEPANADDDASTPTGNSDGTGDSDSDVVVLGEPPAALELSVDQLVGVAEGAFTPADTPEAAVPAQVGDSVKWKVAVTPVFVPSEESRTVKIVWTPTSNVELTGHDASAGAYDGFVWTVDIAQLPAELIIHTLLKNPGSAQAVATITQISCAVDGVETFCDFEDSIASNNTNPSVITTDAPMPTDPSAEPASGEGVLGANTEGRGGEGVMMVKDASVNPAPTPSSGVLSARTTARGGEGRRVTYLAGSNGVLGVASGSLADTGLSAGMYLVIGAVLCVLPLAVASVKPKQ